MKNQLILILLTSLSFISVQAQSTEVYHMVQGNNAQRLDNEKADSWSWTQKDTGAPRFKNEVLVSLPGSQKRTAVKSKYGTSRLTEGGRKLLVSSHYLNNLVLASDGKKKEKLLIISKLSKSLFSEGCEPSFITIKAKNEEFPGPMGLLCQPAGDLVTFSIAFPGEVSWSSSSLFEKDGKGESWKIFEVSKAHSQSGASIGSFTIVYKKKSYQYDILSTYTKGQNDSDEKKNRYQVILGNVALSAKDTNTNTSESPFFIGGRLLSQPVYRSLRMGLDLNISQSFTSDENTQPLTYKEFRAYANYDLFKSSFDIAPRIYTVFTDASDPNSGLKMVHQNLGIGVAARLKMTKDLRAQAVYLQSGFLGSVATRHTSIQFELGYSFTNFELGLGLELNSYKFKTETRGDPEFTQSIYYLSVRF